MAIGIYRKVGKEVRGRWGGQVGGRCDNPYIDKKRYKVEVKLTLRTICHILKSRHASNQDFSEMLKRPSEFTVRILPLKELLGEYKGFKENLLRHGSEGRKERREGGREGKEGREGRERRRKQRYMWVMCLSVCRSVCLCMSVYLFVFSFYLYCIKKSFKSSRLWCIII